MPSNFTQMIETAKTQEQTQRLLIMLAKTEIEVNDLMSGQDLSQYLVLDRNEDPINIFAE